MVKVALFVRLEAKPGKETNVESFLRGGLPIVQKEPATIAWFGIRLGPTTFCIFDAFPDEAGRQAHLSGEVAAALMAKAPEHLHAFLSAFGIHRSDVFSSTASKFVIKKNAVHRIDIGSLWQFGQ